MGSFPETYNDLACVAGARKKMGTRKNRRTRGRLASLLLSRAFFLATIYFLAPATQANNDPNLPCTLSRDIFQL